MPTDAPSAGPPASIWSLKPWWCQPWSIITTGVVVLAASLLWPARWWVSLVPGVLIGLWWLLFLVLVPSAWARDQGLEAEDLCHEARDNGPAGGENGLSSIKAGRRN